MTNQPWSPVAADSYDNTELSKKMACIDLIEMWCTAVRAKVESELVSGHEVEGYKLVQGKKGNRAWTDAEEVETTMKSMRTLRACSS